jgi:hypothetical protein
MSRYDELIGRVRAADSSLEMESNQAVVKWSEVNQPALSEIGDTLKHLVGLGRVLDNISEQLKQSVIDKKVTPNEHAGVGEKLSATKEDLSTVVEGLTRRCTSFGRGMDSAIIYAKGDKPMPNWMQKAIDQGKTDVRASTVIDTELGNCKEKTSKLAKRAALDGKSRSLQFDPKTRSFRI